MVGWTCFAGNIHTINIVVLLVYCVSSSASTIFRLWLLEQFSTHSIDLQHFEHCLTSCGRLATVGMF